MSGVEQIAHAPDFNGVDSISFILMLCIRIGIRLSKFMPDKNNTQLTRLLNGLSQTRLILDKSTNIWKAKENSKHSHSRREKNANGKLKRC